MSVSEPNLTASEASAVSLLETFAAVARRRTSATSTVSSTNTKNQSTSNTTSTGTTCIIYIFKKNNMFGILIPWKMKIFISHRYISKFCTRKVV